MRFDSQVGFRFQQFLMMCCVTTTLFVQSTWASVHLSWEEDPFPNVDLSIVLPVGIDGASSEEVGALTVLAELFEDGPAQMGKSAFQNALSKFGGEFRLTPQSDHSLLSVGYLAQNNVALDEFIELVSKTWREPSFSGASVERAKKKVMGTIFQTLDSDMALGAAAARRLLSFEGFSTHPVFLDSISKINSGNLKDYHAKMLSRVSTAFVGVVGPKTEEARVMRLVSTLLRVPSNTLQNVASESDLPLVFDPKSRGALKEIPKTLLIIDKDGRTQTPLGALYVSRKSLTEEEELQLDLARYILTDSGLASIFAAKIRGERGLAYAVGGVQPYYRGFPVQGMASNPQLSRIDEALTVVSQLLNDTYASGETLEKVSREEWNRLQQAYRLSRVLEQSSSESRMTEKVAVVRGVVPRAQVTRAAEDWKLPRNKTESLVPRAAQVSNQIVYLVGDAKTLKPSLTKHFSGWRWLVLSPEQSINSEGFKAQLKTATKL